MNALRELRSSVRRYRRLPSTNSDDDSFESHKQVKDSELSTSTADSADVLDVSFKRMLERDPRCTEEPAVNLMQDYIIVESRTSHAEPIFPMSVSGSRCFFTRDRIPTPLSPLGSTSGEDDDVWTVSIETPTPQPVSTTPLRPSTNTHHRLYRANRTEASLKCSNETVSNAQLAAQLAATQAALHEERQRRQKLEESFRRLRSRSLRVASTSSEPGSLTDIISPHDVLTDRTDQSDRPEIKILVTDLQREAGVPFVPTHELLLYPSNYRSRSRSTAYAEELSQRLAIQLDLEGKEYLIEKMRKAHAGDDAAPVEGWLEVSPNRGNHEVWHEEYLALSSRRLLFFHSSEDFVRQKPCRVVQLDKIITVRNVEDDLHGALKTLRAPCNDQCCIQVSYAAEGETKAIQGLDDTRDTEKLLRGYLDYKESQRASRILYIRTKTYRDKQLWLKRLKTRLAACPYTGSAGMAGGALLHCLHNLKEYSAEGE